MKHTLLYIGLALASFMMQPAAVQAKARKEAKVVKQLVVLHTNDTHSCVMPVNPISQIRQLPIVAVSSVGWR